MINEEIWGKPKPGVENFFELISSVIREFASNHNLKIEKYYHNKDGWDSVFQHPKGGACYIDVVRKDERHVLICGDWWIDDLRTSERFDKHTERIECSIDKEALSDRLENLFLQVISWEKKDLISLGKSFSPLKKEDVEADLKRYPVPKL
jgi:hypothetical protein